MGHRSVHPMMGDAAIDPPSHQSVRHKLWHVLTVCFTFRQRQADQQYMQCLVTDDDIWLPSIGKDSPPLSPTRAVSFHEASRMTPTSRAALDHRLSMQREIIFEREVQQIFEMEAQRERDHSGIPLESKSSGAAADSSLLEYARNSHLQV